MRVHSLAHGIGSAHLMMLFIIVKNSILEHYVLVCPICGASCAVLLDEVIE
jgi:hypothetical protein